MMCDALQCLNISCNPRIVPSSGVYVYHLSITPIKSAAHTKYCHSGKSDKSTPQIRMSGTAGCSAAALLRRGGAGGESQVMTLAR